MWTNFSNWCISIVIILADHTVKKFLQIWRITKGLPNIFASFHSFYTIAYGFTFTYTCTCFGASKASWFMLHIYGMMKHMPSSLWFLHSSYMFIILLVTHWIPFPVILWLLQESISYAVDTCSMSLNSCKTDCFCNHITGCCSVCDHQSIMCDSCSVKDGWYPSS